jgi:aconitate hydratase
VIDHSVMVDNFGHKDSFKKNVVIEYQRNKERYGFLRWGQQAFANFRVVPPGTGICHQVNLEYLAQTVWTRKDQGREDEEDRRIRLPRHAGRHRQPHDDGQRPFRARLGRGRHRSGSGDAGPADLHADSRSDRLPRDGQIREGVTATDLVLTVTQMLRKKGVVGKFVEFYGPGLDEMALEDRATIANMAPEYGATCGFFPIDSETLHYLKATARKPARVALVEKYAKAQGLFRTAKSEEPVFTDTLALDLATVEPSLAGPRRPQDRVSLANASQEFATALMDVFKKEDDANRA